MTVYWRPELSVKKTARREALTVTAAPAAPSLPPSCPPLLLFNFLKFKHAFLTFLKQTMSYVNNLAGIDDRKYKAISSQF